MIKLDDNILNYMQKIVEQKNPATGGIYKSEIAEYALSKNIEFKKNESKEEILKKIYEAGLKVDLYNQFRDRYKVTRSNMKYCYDCGAVTDDDKCSKCKSDRIYDDNDEGLTEKISHDILWDIKSKK